MRDALRHGVLEGRRELLSRLRAGLPVAVLLALAVGLVVVVGANLSNAFPSASKPFGWPGVANIENGVAMVRPELVLAASLPALLLGLRALPRDLARRHVLPSIGAGVVLVSLATLAATLIGAAAAAKSPPQAYYVFWVAHTLLGLSMFSLGFLATAVSRRHAPVTGLAAWGGFAFLMDNVVRWRLFRSTGYDNLAAGLLPNWFYVMQALSPVSAYRAVLILWRPGFRDFLEKAALDGAAMPPWLSAGAVAFAMLVLWVLIPLAIAAGILLRRTRSTAMPLMPVSPLAGNAGQAQPAASPVGVDVAPAVHAEPRATVAAAAGPNADVPPGMQASLRPKPRRRRW